MHVAARRWLLAFAVFGLVTSGTSTYVHYQLLKDRGYTSFCDLNPTVSCSEAYLSPYGSFAGLPVALLGFLWFVLAALLAWVAVRGRPGEQAARDSAPGYLFVLSTIGLAMVLYLAYAAFFVLREVCVLCVGTYIAVLGLFLVSGSVMDYPMTTLPTRLARDARRLFATPVALAVAVVFLGGAASAIAFFPRDSALQSSNAAPAAQAAPTSAPSQSEFERWYFTQPMADAGVPMDGAKVLVVKFNDYQCPACGQSYFDYKSVLAKYEASNPGAVRMVVKDYPLDPECNFNTPGGAHQAACEAAVAARLAARKGKGEAMEEWLYSNQVSLTPQSVRQAAAAIGGVPDFDAQYQRVLQEVRADVAVGGAVNVRSTPTFIINGRVIKGALPVQYFEQAIAIELKRAGGK
ncbi:MAG TPA: vitamin K epoxide reductase family protein [Vicinamibacterales bacterium]|nr:vitamin K epoxide reductase family protein [Vicinamibacterales bacterium]